jgi:hypothetical protein
MIVSLTHSANRPNILNDYFSFNFVCFKDSCLPLSKENYTFLKLYDSPLGC